MPSNKILLSFGLLALPFLASADKPEATKLIQKCLPKSHWAIMSSIVAIESNYHLYAIGVNKNGHKDYYPSSKREAKKIVQRLIEQNVNFDIGLAQINSAHFSKGRFFQKKGLTHFDALDPCNNLKMGATIFSDNFRRYGDIAKALSAYNTGNHEKGFRNGYVDKYVSISNGKRVN